MNALALPDLAVMQVWLHTGWALVLGGMAAAVLQRYGVQRRLGWAVPLVLAVWAAVPGPLSAAYWLGLAFGAPSAVLALGCGWAGLRAWGVWKMEPVRATQPQAGAVQAEQALLWLGVVLGWVLLLDTLAQWPLALYGLGFGRGAWVLVSVLALLPLLQAGAARRASAWLLPAALVLFALLRLPTGNVWDAVLDPWLWLGLQVVLVRRLWRCWRGRSVR